jgi:predicted ATPase
MAAVNAFYGATMFHQFRGDAERVLEFADRSWRLGSKHGLGEGLALADVHRGWALSVQGQSHEGIALARAGAEMLRRAGALMYLPYVLGLLADASRSAGHVAEARQSLNEALETVTRNGPGWYDAELHRLDGELKLTPSHPGATDEAETSFGRAIAIARRQQAKSWELRAALSLARLWRQQGQEREARQLVSETYSWFTEGFDTPDLRAARAFVTSTD